MGEEIKILCESESITIQNLQRNSILTKPISSQEATKVKAKAKAFLVPNFPTSSFGAEDNTDLKTPIFHVTCASNLRLLDSSRSTSTERLYDEPSPLQLSQKYEEEEVRSLRKDSFSLAMMSNSVEEKKREEIVPNKSLNATEASWINPHRRARSFSIHNLEDFSYLAKNCQEYINLYIATSLDEYSN